MEIIRCENLSKIYQMGENKVYALNGVSVGFEEGTFTAIVGPSGSGKSTFLHLLSGLDRPTGGKVFYQDNELYQYGDNQLSVLRRRRFGFVFQSYNLVKELTGMENILLPVMLDSRKLDKDYMDHVIDILGIRDRLNHLPGAMSGGQQQRVSIARALANKPGVLFADEPTGNLDGKSGREVLQLLRQVSHDLGVTLILVTHDVHVAEQSHRILFLEDGTISRDTAEGN
ncbi:MAG: ABC transporter ATP-binding protein [Clostridia bacterium]|nr:ABC transporter ATP-binding protein [Clostridia bacterium]MBO4884377.1 ABC transporter ATP-binding protein [Clostridia bacterium]